MRAHARLGKKIEEVELTLSITMRLQDWRELVQKMPREWPAWSVANLIAAAINRVDSLANQFVDGEEIKE